MTFYTLENDIASLEINDAVIIGGIVLENVFSLAPLWLFATMDQLISCKSDLLLFAHSFTTHLLSANHITWHFSSRPVFLGLWQPTYFMVTLN